jgi:hypothetical protein
MRTTLVLVLAFFAQPGIQGRAQQQVEALPTGPGVTNWHFTHPSTERLFFFTSDPNDTWRPVTFVRPMQPLRTGGLVRPSATTTHVFRTYAIPPLTFPPIGLLPAERTQHQNFVKLLRPKNTKLFFFTKP